jgi:hypothetical protein
MHFDCSAAFQSSLTDAFDYIDCCGVLHHLQQPHAGLRALVAALAPGGAIGVMMYGALGRTGVYAVQRLMRVLREARRRRRHHDQNEDDDAEADTAWELDVLSEVLRHLPPTHPLRCNRAMMNAADLDSREGRVDLFLHACDTACEIDQLDALLHCAGLQVCARLPRGRADAELSLPAHAAAPHLRSVVGALSSAEEALVCELFSGAHACHVVLATRASGDAIGALLPCTVSSFPDALEAAFEELTHSAVEATELARGGTAAVLPCSTALWAELRRWVLVPVFVYTEDIEQRYGAELALLSRAATRLVLRNIDGERTLQHVFDRYAQTESVGAFLADVRALWRLLEPRGLLCGSLTPFPLLWEHSYQ